MFPGSHRRPDRRKKKRDRRKYFLPFLLVLLLLLGFGGYYLFNFLTGIEELTTEIGEPTTDITKPVLPTKGWLPAEISLIGLPPGIMGPAPPNGITGSVPPANGEGPTPFVGTTVGPVINEPIDLELIDNPADTSSGDAGHWEVAANGEDPNKYYVDFGNLVISRNQIMYVGDCSEEVFALQNNSSAQLTLTLEGVSGRDDLVYTFRWCVDGGGIAILWMIDNDANTGNGSGVIPANGRATVCIEVETSGASPSTGTFAGEWTIHANAP